jgi:chromosome segregation ATPase
MALHEQLKRVQTLEAQLASHAEVDVEHELKQRQVAHDAAIAQLERAHSSTVVELKKVHAEALAALGGARDAAVVQLDAAHQAQIGGLNEAHAGALRKARGRAAKELAFVSEQLTEKEAETARLQAEVASLHARLEGKDAEQEEIEVELSRTSHQLGQLKASHSSTQSQLVTLEAQAALFDEERASLKATLRDLKEQLQEANVHLSNMRASEEDSHKLASDVTSMQTAHAEAQAALKLHIEQLKEEKTDLVHQVQHVQSEHDQIETRLQQVRNSLTAEMDDMAKIQARLEKQSAQLAAQLETKDSLIADLQAELDESRQHASSPEIREPSADNRQLLDLEQRLAKATRAASRWENEANAMSKQLQQSAASSTGKATEGTTSGTKVHELQERLTRANDLVAALRAAANGILPEMPDTEEIHRTVAKQEYTISKLHDELAEADRKLKEEGARCKRLKQVAKLDDAGAEVR